MSALGQKADMAAHSSDVRFTPNSGHWNSFSKCPLCAKSGHWQRVGDATQSGHPRLQPSHQAPSARVEIVIGMPARQYAQNDISMPAARARSATMRLATEPTGVRLPAKVALIAITSQMRC